jgi:hypothetical protein
MTAALPEDPGTEPVGSLEVRWIFHGELDTAMTAGSCGSRPRNTPMRISTCLIRTCPACR